MKQIIITLTLLMYGLFPASAVKKITANPINVAVSLIERTDSTKVASILDYHGYTYQGTDDGFIIMKDSNGNEIRYSFADDKTDSGYPTIIVKTNETSTAIDSRLKNMKFEKSGNAYERMRNQYSKFKTKCSFGSHSLIFRQVPN